MTNIYLIRHTQAEGNLYRFFQGHWDSDVSEKGRLQVEALAARFKNIHIDAVYSSDLYRTRYTATAAARWDNLPVVPVPALREVNMGVWEAGFFGDIERKYPEMMHNFRHNISEWKVDGSESCDEIVARALPALIKIAEENDGKTIAVSSHGMTIRCLLAAIRGINYNDQDFVNNTGVSLLHYENGRFDIEYIGDESHLSGASANVKSSVPNLRAENFVPRTDDEYYTRCYADCWQTVHGNLRGFSAKGFLAAAKRHSYDNPAAVMKIFCGDEPVGLVDCDTARGKDEGYGWISLLYLNAENRGKGMGIQLLARAIMLFRSLGRKSIRLSCADSNACAIAFYKKYGFKIIDTEEARNGPVYIMEAPLDNRRPL